MEDNDDENLGNLLGQFENVSNKLNTLQHGGSISSRDMEDDITSGVDALPGVTSDERLAALLVPGPELILEDPLIGLEDEPTIEERTIEERLAALYKEPVSDERTIEERLADLEEREEMNCDQATQLLDVFEDTKRDITSALLTNEPIDLDETHRLLVDELVKFLPIEPDHSPPPIPSIFQGMEIEGPPPIPYIFQGMEIEGLKELEEDLLDEEFDETTSESSRFRGHHIGRPSLNSRVSGLHRVRQMIPHHRIPLVDEIEIEDIELEDGNPIEIIMLNGQNVLVQIVEKKLEPTTELVFEQIVLSNDILQAIYRDLLLGRIDIPEVISIIERLDSGLSFLKIKAGTTMDDAEEEDSDSEDSDSDDSDSDKDVEDVTHMMTSDHEGVTQLRLLIDSVLRGFHGSGSYLQHYWEIIQYRGKALGARFIRTITHQLNNLKSISLQLLMNMLKYGTQLYEYGTQLYSMMSEIIMAILTGSKIVIVEAIDRLKSALIKVFYKIGNFLKDLAIKFYDIIWDRLISLCNGFGYLLKMLLKGFSFSTHQFGKLMQDLKIVVLFLRNKIYSIEYRQLLDPVIGGLTYIYDEVRDRAQEYADIIVHELCRGLQYYGPILQDLILNVLSGLFGFAAQIADEGRQRSERALTEVQRLGEIGLGEVRQRSVRALAEGMRLGEIVLVEGWRLGGEVLGNIRTFLSQLSSYIINFITVLCTHSKERILEWVKIYGPLIIQAILYILELIPYGLGQLLGVFVVALQKLVEYASSLGHELTRGFMWLSKELWKILRRLAEMDEQREQDQYQEQEQGGIPEQGGRPEPEEQRWACPSIRPKYCSEGERGTYVDNRYPCIRREDNCKWNRDQFRIEEMKRGDGDYLAHRKQCIVNGDGDHCGFW